MVVVASEEQGTRQPCVLAAMTRFSNKAILQQVRRGTATFELVAGGEEGQQQQQKEQQKGGGAGTLLSLLLSPFFGSPDTTRQPLPHALCFAKIGTRGGALPARSTTSQAVKKLEHYTVRRIVGDGRCMFRALVLGMAANKGLRLDDVEETQEADQLRLAVMDALCRSDKRRRLYEEALIAITVEESLKRYCQRIPSSNFWGGESELLVLSRMCSQPIVVYIPESEANEGAKWGTGFIPIAEYGSEFTKPSKDRKGRKPVRLLYNGSNHYDLLI